jgi:hypothetical protein
VNTVWTDAHDSTTLTTATAMMITCGGPTSAAALMRANPTPTRLATLAAIRTRSAEVRESSSRVASASVAALVLAPDPEPDDDDERKGCRVPPAEDADLPGGEGGKGG